MRPHQHPPPADPLGQQRRRRWCPTRAGRRRRPTTAKPACLVREAAVVDQQQRAPAASRPNWVQVRRLVTTSSRPIARRRLARAAAARRGWAAAPGTASRGARRGRATPRTTAPGTQEDEGRALVEQRDGRAPPAAGPTAKPGVAAHHEPGEPGGRAPARDPVRHPRGLGVEGGDAEPRAHDARRAPRRSRPRGPPGRARRWPTATPPHRNAGVARRSASRPKSGWMAEETSREAPEDHARLRGPRARRRAVKTGSIAGTAPTVASITKWPRRQQREPAPGPSPPSGARAGGRCEVIAGDAPLASVPGCPADGDDHRTRRARGPPRRSAPARRRARPACGGVARDAFAELRGARARRARPSASASPQARTPPSSPPSSGSSSEPRSSTPVTASSVVLEPSASGGATRPRSAMRS